MIQRSDEWYKAKCGIISSSRINDVVSGKSTAGYNNLVASLVLERITGIFEQSYTSKPMEHGINTEEEARAEYEALTGSIVNETGLIIKSGSKYFGCSPDGLVSDDGLIEIKCPNSSTHMNTLLTQKIPLKYIRQMQWQMYITSRKWCDFVSYDPRHPDYARLFIKRVERDDSIISELLTASLDMLKVVESKIKALEALRK